MENAKPYVIKYIIFFAKIEKIGFNQNHQKIFKSQNRKNFYDEITFSEI